MISCVDIFITSFVYTNCLGRTKCRAAQFMGLIVLSFDGSIYAARVMLCIRQVSASAFFTIDTVERGLWNTDRRVATKQHGLVLRLHIYLGVVVSVGCS